MTNCKYCKADCIFRGEQQTKECKGYIPMTNADRIRAMNDEELAEYIVSLTASEFIGNVKAQSEIISGTRITETQIAEAIESLRQAWLEWLQNPAE